jgi:predicted DNA-binding transcriptional regulator AlpA
MVVMRNYSAIAPLSAATGQGGINDPILNPQQTADYIGSSVPTLQRFRTEGTGPRFIKLGKRRVAYRLSDIRSWLDERVAASTADARDRGLSA